MSSSEKIEQVVDIISKKVLKEIEVPKPDPAEKVDYDIVDERVAEFIKEKSDILSKVDYERLEKIIKGYVKEYAKPGKNADELDYNRVQALLKKMIKPGKPGKNAEIDYVRLETMIAKHTVPGKPGKSPKIDYKRIEKYVKQNMSPDMEELEAIVARHSKPAEITKSELKKIASLVEQPDIEFPEFPEIPRSVVDVLAKENNLIIMYSDGTEKELPLELTFVGGGGGAPNRKQRTRVYEARLKVLVTPILAGTNISLANFTSVSGQVNSLGNSATEFNKNSGLYIWVDGVKGLKGTLAAGDDIEYVDSTTFKVFRDLNINEILTIEEIG